MKIAVFGTGGVGGYFGGLLAKAGHEVHFIARGDHLRAIRENGLQVDSVNGDFRIDPASATSIPAEVGPADYVILAVKHYHLAEAVQQLKPLVGPSTTVVPLLNGIDGPDVLIKAIGSGPVAGGLCSLVSMVAAPGVIRQVSKLRSVTVGELDHRPSERVEKLAAAWAGEGADARQSLDIQADMWGKLVFIASFGGVGSLTRANMGEVLAAPAARQLFIDAMGEIAAVAEAQGVRLSPDVVQQRLAMAEGFEPTATSSMQRDVEAGKMFELDAFSGTVVRLAEQCGTPTPVHKAIYGLLQPALRRAMNAA